MLLQLRNIISNYSISIQDINIEYCNEFEYFDNAVTCLIRSSGAVYNYRKTSGIQYAIRNKNLYYVSKLPRNYMV